MRPAGIPAPTALFRRQVDYHGTGRARALGRQGRRLHPNPVRTPTMIPVIYHPRYDITAFGLERLHPFDGRKYRRIHDALIARGLRSRSDFVRPAPVGPDELRRVHTPEYLRSLRDPRILAGILEM
ncbi:MAG TPA: hypothetical protein VFF52_06855, partial [Isosphaeraceae bacterium]|nr:hypothetical protein [Isosphaeraceae bacterium]